MKVLDVGCGNAKIPNAIGIDNNPVTDVDVLVDVNHLPWPFEESTFDRVVCRHVIEHVTDMMTFVEEIHRVCKNGAFVEIVTPHFSNRYSYTDPTHLRHLAWRSFDYFTDESAAPKLTFWDRMFQIRHPIQGYYTKVRFRRRHTLLDFGRPFRLLGIQWMANCWPDFYEQYLAFLFPARDLYVELEVLK